MIPCTIQLKNFLSYGPEPQSVDFSFYNLICLSGKNGHGKSALLDAITWAIWGQARKSSGNSKADQGLLHLGQKHMFVILELEVNRQKYRIRREFVQTNSKPFASLDFGIIQQDKKCIPLTDKTIKATQDKIEKTIGITYESFINSAFLRQGQSNEFSKKSPKERKEILATILQLQKFEDQKKIASFHAKKLTQEHKTLCSIQQRIETELESLKTIDQQYQVINQQFKSIEQEKNNFTQKKENLEKSKKVYFQQNKELELFKNQYQESFIQIKKSNEEIDELSKKIQLLEQSSSFILKKDLEEKQKLLQQNLQVLQEKWQQKLIFKEEYLLMKEELSKFISLFEKNIILQIQLQQTNLIKSQEKINQLYHLQKQEQHRSLNIDKEIIALKNELDLLQRNIEKNKIQLQQYHHYDGEMQRLKVEHQSLVQQEIILQNQLQHLTIQHCSLGQQAICPLCTNSLSNDEQISLQKKLSLEQKTVEEQLFKIKDRIPTIFEEVTLIQKKLDQTKKVYDETLSFTTKEQELTKIAHKLHEQKKELDQNSISYQQQITETTLQSNKIQKKITLLEQSKNNISHEEQYQSFQKKLTHIQHLAKELHYDQELHKKTESDLQELCKQLMTIKSVTNEIEKLTEYKAHLISLAKTKLSQTEQLQVIEQHIQKYQLLPQQQKNIALQEQELFQQQNLLEQKQAQLLTEKGALEQKQKKQLDLSQELAQIIKNSTLLYQEILDYQEIAKALGKDGIQALLIEQAIPEIEAETNEILARLTNNQTQIFIESLRDLKKGGSKETLDIKISDAFGLRDYEMFSGGEAFRIDFALRIGISKILARRAGTTLQTIFIDEGFGSQDEEGLQLIMDNLYKIQNDFAKIIIVSHLSEMKDQFSVQFVVEKKRLGSTISIIEQG
ncbi:SMC family ATPase [Candidatus Dependentiae bacterium]|nr:SMC family ATPase [Candidatus Dependentiae bacterium]